VIPAPAWVRFLNSAAQGAEPESRGATHTSAWATPAFQLKLSADRRYLVDRKEERFLVIGDSLWSLIVEPTPAQVGLYLDDRAAEGFNLLLSTSISIARTCTPPVWNRTPACHGRLVS